MLYPFDSVPAVVRRINNTLRRADQIEVSEGKTTDWFRPIIADAAGFGGNLNASELQKLMIEAGARVCTGKDQLSSAKKWLHGRQSAGADSRTYREASVAARLASDCPRRAVDHRAAPMVNGAYLLIVGCG